MKLTIDIPDRAAFIAFSIITIACAVYYILYVPVILDDSYVYFRVAERFASTGVPTFNDGDAGNITTSPLWLIILTVAYIVTGGVSLVILSKIFSIILMIGAAWLLYRILEKRLIIAAPFAGIAVFFAPSMNVLVGHDTAIALICALVVINAFESDKKSLPIWVALFYLARGEGIVFGGIVALIALFRGSWKERIQYYLFSVLIGAALILIWHGFYWSVFGDVFPSTLAIKRLQAEGGWATFAAYIWQHLNWINATPFNLATISFAIIGSVLMLWQIPSLAFWPIIHFAVYALINVPNYGWYYYPIDFVLGLSILIAVAYSVVYVFDNILRYILNVEVFNSIQKIFVIVLSIIIISIVQPILQPAIISIIRGNAFLSDARHIAYTELSTLMPGIAGRADFTLLTHEIGIFGFLQPQAHIRDVVGLATPVHNKAELWNWDGRATQFNPDIILWPFPNPPHYQLFGFKSKVPLKVFKRTAVASNGTPYALYRRINETNTAIKKQVAALQSMVAGATRLSAPAEAMGLDNDHIGFFAHAPSNIFLDIPADAAAAITLGFGYKNGAWQGANDPDGANFVVRSSNGKLLLHRWLDPKRIATDRGTQFVTVNLPSGIKRIELVIEPGSNTSWDWTYWAAHTWHDKAVLNVNSDVLSENINNSKFFKSDRFDIIKGGGDVITNPLILLDNRYVRNAHSNSLLAYYPSSADFELCFGLRPGAWDKPEFDGVKFSARNDANQSELFTVILHPSHSPTSSQCKLIHLPSADKSKIMLETLENGNSSYDWAYWEVKHTSNLDDPKPPVTSTDKLENPNIKDATTCIGNIDGINGSIAPKQFSITTALNIRGWLAQSPTQGLPESESAILILTDSTGKNILFKTQIEQRQDVATHFNNPALSSSGFTATINVASMSGSYTLGLGFVEGETIKLCPQFKIQGTINKQ